MLICRFVSNCYVGVAVFSYDVLYFVMMLLSVVIVVFDVVCFLMILMCIVFLKYTALLSC